MGVRKRENVSRLGASVRFLREPQGERGDGIPNGDVGVCYREGAMTSG